MAWWDKPYHDEIINKNINNYLNLSHKIKFYLGDISCEDLILFVYRDEYDYERGYYDPRNEIIIKSLFLNDEDKNKLNKYINTYGKSLLDYQFRKVSYKDLKYLPD